MTVEPARPLPPDWREIIKAKPAPFAHQVTALERSWDLEYFGLFMEQGTGKTKVTLDTAQLLFKQGLIRALVVICYDPGAHQLWVKDELPKHVNPRHKAQGIYWRSAKAKAKWFQELWRDVSNAPGLQVFAFTADGAMTASGKRALRNLLDSRRCLLVIDESTLLKNPGSQRTKSLRAVGRYAAYRRILTGTPVTNGPFDVYGQIRFLSAEPFSDCPTALTFRHRYGKWITQESYSRSWPVCVGYQNLDELTERLDAFTYRCLKADCLDLPAKLYTQRYIELTPHQRRVYDRLREEATLEIGGRESTGLLAITALLRMQQITSNFIPVDAQDGDESVMRSGDEVHRVDTANPRRDEVVRIVEELAGKKIIIFCRFRQEVADIIDALSGLGHICATYVGGLTDEEKAEARRGFQDGDTQVLICTQRAAARVITLTAASAVLFYSNTFSLEDRLQAEDRAHRIGLDHAVTYIDLIARGTVDEYIVAALRRKLDVAVQVQADPPREWLELTEATGLLGHYDEKDL